MKKLKIIFSLILFTIFFSLISPVKVVNADMGPKPASYITIKGIEGDYIACFAAQNAFGPNIDYEMWLEYQDESWTQEYNPIMEYKDEEGFKWINCYYVCHDESKISFTYYCPSVYKIVIYQNDELYKVTEALEMYAYATYYEIDFSKGTINTPEDIKVTNTYDYIGEILSLLFRIVATLIVEIGVFYLFRLYTKRNLNVVLIINLITQIFLNVAVNIMNYTSGSLGAIFLLYTLEFIILIIEFIAYQFLLKDKNRLMITIYPIIANLLSFGLGLVLLNYL